MDGLPYALRAVEMPFTIDHIPLSALNAGGASIIECISSRYSGWERLKVGDNVEYYNRGIFKIEEDRGDFFKLKDRKGLVSREELQKSDNKEIDKNELEKFKQDIVRAAQTPKTSENFKLKL